MTYLSKSFTSTSASACLITLLFAACGGDDGNGYPSDWPALATKPRLSLTGRGCPDLKGTYGFDAAAVDGTTFGALSSFLGVGVTQVYNAPLLSFTIAGDAASMLTITFSRAHSALTGPGTAPETQTVTALHGSAYTCDGGWLVSAKQDMVMKTAQHNLIHRNEVSYRTGSAGPQIASFRRDIEGALVAYSNVREARVFSLWAETGAGIPYWFDTHTYWARWLPVYETPGTVKINPATTGRLERQAYEQENGIGSYAAAVAPAKSDAAAAVPAVPATPATPVAASAAPQTLEAMRARVARRVDRNASLEAVRREGDRYVLTLRVSARGQVTRTIENLSEDTAFSEIQDHGIVDGGNQPGIATISLRRNQQ